jgi:hypothetical protein
LAAAALAQTNNQAPADSAKVAPGIEISSGTGTLKSGVGIRYKTVATPDGAFLNLIAEGISVSYDAVHRFVIDKTTASYFGYDLVIDPADANNLYRAVFQPLTGVDDLVAHLSGNPSLKPMMLPRYPAPQMVREGDVIALDVMVSPDGTRKITDYVEVLAPPGSPATDLGAEALDFTLDDGPVTFNGMRPGLWVNGQAKELAAFTGKPGATFWIAFPGQGRYILSLTPHDGFAKGGTMHGDTISFQDEGQQYDVRFESPIASRGKAWNLYVLHDVSYRPNAAGQGIVSAGTDRLDNLWPNR